MLFEEALFSYLISCSGVIEIVSDRIYPIIMPEESIFPAITYQKVSGERQHVLRGDTGCTKPVFQLSCWAQSYSECKELAKQLRTCLQNYSGTMGGTDGIYISAVLLEGEYEGYESDTRTYYINMDYQFIFTEQI